MYNYNKPINSYWESVKPNIDFQNYKLNSESRSEIVVIGGGYTGLSCALQLSKKYNYDVSVLEAGHIGFGSSGRNAGFVCMNPTKLSLKQLIKRYGLDETKYYFKCKKMD